MQFFSLVKVTGLPSFYSWTLWGLWVWIKRPCFRSNQLHVFPNTSTRCRPTSSLLRRLRIDLNWAGGTRVYEACNPHLHPSPPFLYPCPFPLPLAPVLSFTLPAARCVFLPDNGAFFVNYVITSALLGTGMELLRLGSLFLYSIRLFFSRSEPERVHIRKVGAGPFPAHSLQSSLWEGVRKGGLLEAGGTRGER